MENGLWSLAWVGLLGLSQFIAVIMAVPLLVRSHILQTFRSLGDFTNLQKIL